MRIDCLRPIRLFVPDKINGGTRPILVGCGHCECCCQKKRNDWKFRLTQEHKYCRDGYFVTLTYDPENLPPYGWQNGKTYVQKFLKRFRKNYGLINLGFKYYLVSELGGKHGRLHYHALFFNTGMSWQALLDAIKKTWHAGIVRLNVITDKRINYVSSYCLQGTFNKRFFTPYDKFREHPKSFFFMICSHGLGKPFLTSQMIDYIFYHDGTIQVNGFTKAIPKYYLNVLEKYYPAEVENIRLLRLNKAFEIYEEYIEKYQEHRKHCFYCTEMGCPYTESDTEFGQARQECEERERRIRSQQKSCKYVCPDIDPSLLYDKDFDVPLRRKR